MTSNLAEAAMVDMTERGIPGWVLKNPSGSDQPAVLEVQWKMSEPEKHKGKARLQRATPKIPASGHKISTVNIRKKWADIFSSLID